MTSRHLTMSTSLAALKNIAAQLRIDSVRSTSEAGTGHPTTCLSAADIVSTLFFDEMRFDAEGSAQPRQRSVRAVEGARGADPVRRVGGGRAVPARGPAEAAPDRIGSRGPSDAAAVVRGRRDRLARPGHLRRDRHRAQRPPHRLRLPHLRALRRRRDGRGLGVGSRRRRAALQARQPLRHHRRQRRSARARTTQFGHDMDAIAARWNAFGWHAIVVDGHDIPALQKALRGGARRRQGTPDDDAGAHAEGQRAGRRSRARRAGTARRSRRARRPTSAIAELQAQIVRRRRRRRRSRARDRRAGPRRSADYSKLPAPAYKMGDSIATREAWGVGARRGRRGRSARSSRSTPT